MKKINLFLVAIIFLVLAISSVSAYHDTFTYDHHSFYNYRYLPRYNYNAYPDSFFGRDFDGIIISPRSSRSIGRLNSPTIYNYNIYSPSYDRPTYNRYNQYQNYRYKPSSYSRYPSYLQTAFK